MHCICEKPISAWFYFEKDFNFVTVILWIIILWTEEIAIIISQNIKPNNFIRNNFLLMFHMEPMHMRKGHGNIQKIVALYPGAWNHQINELTVTWAHSELSWGAQPPEDYFFWGAGTKKTELALKWFSCVSCCHRQGHEKGSNSPEEIEGGQRWDGQRRGEQPFHWPPTFLWSQLSHKTSLYNLVRNSSVWWAWQNKGMSVLLVRGLKKHFHPTSS